MATTDVSIAGTNPQYFDTPKFIFLTTIGRNITVTYIVYWDLYLLLHVYNSQGKDKEV